MSHNPLHADRILTRLSEGVAVLDSAGHVQVSNPAFLDLLGVSRLEDSTLTSLFASNKLLADVVRRALNGEDVVDVDVRHALPDHTEVSMRWLRINAVKFTDPNTSSTNTTITLVDVSDLKSAERQMWQVEKMSALGRLAASVAHEVGNPLGAIDIQLQLLQEDLSTIDGALPDKTLRRIDIARAEMRRLEGIVQNFLRLSRPPALHLKRVDPNDLLNNIYQLVAPEAREKSLHLHLELGHPLRPVKVDENQLSQCLLNLLINAFQAVGDQGNIRLRSREEDGDVLIEIADDGPGIPPEDLERIFEFYYTTKEEGTGLGLSIAQRIVHQHAGTLSVDSQQGEGTRIAIRLPGIPPPP